MLISRSTIPRGIAAALCLLFAATAGASLQPRTTNIVALVAQSETILRGTVTSVGDGIDARGLPYTEVTMHVADAIRGEGQAGGTYTFRQFGLLKPRRMGNGLTNVMVTPDGWSTYRVGEESILFLHRHAKVTQLQTTVGLAHGKFSVNLGHATNRINNSGLFDHLAVDPGLARSPAERQLMATRQGGVDARAFTSLVHRIVDERWIEQGRIRDAR